MARGTGAVVVSADTRREIVTLAFVGTEISRSNDFFSALKPLFVPIAQDLHGQIFEAETLRTELGRRYGISIPIDVCGLLAVRLHKQRLLSRPAKTQTSALFVWDFSAVVAIYDNEEASTIIDELVTELSAFKAAFPSLVFNQFGGAELLDLFLEYLRSADPDVSRVALALAGAEAPAGQNGGPPSKQVFKDEKAYFSSRFVVHLADNKPHLYKWISRIASAALVSEVILSLKEPPTRDIKLKGACFYLDAPFLMELLGCSGHAAKQDANYTVSRLVTAGARVRALTHSVDEAKKNIRAVLRNDGTQRYGPTHTALVRQETTELYLKSVLENTQEFLSKFSIEQFDADKAPLSAAQKSAFPSQDEQGLAGRLINFYTKSAAAEIDAKSVAFVLRSRGHTKTVRLADAKHVMLTRNDLLCSQTLQYLRSVNKMGAGEVGPVVLAAHVTALLWLASGDQEQMEIDTRHLLLQSDRMVQTSPDVIGALRDRLKEVAPQNAEQFDALMQVPRIFQFALDVAGGSVERAMSLNPMEVFERVRLATAAEERQAHEAKRRAEKQKHQEEKEKLKAGIDDANAQLDAFVLERQRREAADTARAKTIYENLSERRAKTLYYAKICLSALSVLWVLVSLGWIGKGSALEVFFGVLGGPAVMLIGVWWGERLWIGMFNEFWNRKLIHRATEAGVDANLPSRSLRIDG